MWCLRRSLEVCKRARVGRGEIVVRIGSIKEEEICGKKKAKMFAMERSQDTRGRNQP